MNFIEINGSGAGIVIRITNFANMDEAVGQHLPPDQAREFVQWCKKTDCARVGKGERR